jgi:hypothetical protein
MEMFPGPFRNLASDVVNDLVTAFRTGSRVASGGVVANRFRGHTLSAGRTLHLPGTAGFAPN